MLAEEKKLHVVEFRKENDYFPTVVASPPTCRTPEEIKPDEVMDYTQVMQQLFCQDACEESKLIKCEKYCYNNQIV
jgi:hypothetical protein